MKWWKRNSIAQARKLSVASVVFACAGLSACGLFDTREPEPPNASNCFSAPQTERGIVLTNLQNAVAQKCADTYTACFATLTSGVQAFVFVPSAEAREQYGAALSDWTPTDEDAYFRNLISKSVTNGFASLVLVPLDSVITADSAVFNFDYTFIFEHTEPGFPSVARGNLQYTLAPDANNIWRIHRWTDFKTTDEITWSLFKGKFSN
ncbi:MAG: hypothetical protein ACKVRP_02155 [Bacteroidota bacterium]